jgi:translation elongation factor EF-1alpha
VSKVAEVTHYFDRIGVAVLMLHGPLSVGDWIQFVRHGESLFEQEVTSMEVDHSPIASARIGDEVALKVQQVVKEGTEVYLA